MVIKPGMAQSGIYLFSHQKQLALLNELLANRKDETEDQRCEKQYNKKEDPIPLK